MAREIPEAVRAAAGLAATVLDEARRLPETLPGLPVRVLGLAMQVSMKVQQHYAGLVARGDELFTGLRGEDEPGLATFDDDEPATPAARVGRSAFDRVPESVIDVTEDDAAPTDDVLADLALEDLLAETPAESRPDRDADGLEEPVVLEESPDAGIVEAVTEAAADIAESIDLPAAEATAEPTTEPAPEPTAAATGPEDTTPTDEPEGGSDLAGSQAAGTAPIEGYDGWSIAQLRGRLRGYAPSTVQDLLAYEQATRAREPYLRMLRNRLERVNTGV